MGSDVSVWAQQAYISYNLLLITLIIYCCVEVSQYLYYFSFFLVGVHSMLPVGTMSMHEPKYFLFSSRSPSYLLIT